jgi:hypothetical protein
MSTAGGAGRSHVDATHTRPQNGRAASQGSEPASGDNVENGLSDSDPDVSSDDDGCSSEAEQDCSSTSKHSRWPDLDEQRLLASKKEGKSWGVDLWQVPWQDRSTHAQAHALEHDPAQRRIGFLPHSSERRWIRYIRRSITK